MNLQSRFQPSGSVTATTFSRRMSSRGLASSRRCRLAPRNRFFALYSLLAAAGVRDQKKPRRFTEVKRRGRNREEAESLLWGDKEDQSVADRIAASGYAEQTLNHLLAVHCDHTRSNPHVQLFVATRRKKVSAGRTPIGINNRYFLTGKVLRQNRFASPDLLPLSENFP